MKVNIYNEIHKWNSNFLDTVNKPGQKVWRKKREDFFSVQKIGGSLCFIKRSEIGYGESVPFLKQLISKKTTGIPDVYAIEETIENGKPVSYLITEFIKGNILEEHINSGKDISLKKFSEGIINAISTLDKYSFWHTDINADNVYVSSSGSSYLIDVDSCVTTETAPTSDSVKKGGITSASNDLGKYLLKIFKKIKNVNLDYSDISGVNLNYSQAIFLIFQLKYFRQLRALDNTTGWRKSTFRHIALDQMILDTNEKMPKYFSFALNSKLTQPIVEKIAHEIIHNKINTVLISKINKSKLKSTNRSKLTVVKKINSKILKFSTDKDLVSKNSEVRIQWNLIDMQSISIEINGINSNNHPHIGEAKIKIKEDQTIKLKAIGLDKRQYTRNLMIRVQKEESSPIWWIAGISSILYTLYQLVS